MILLFNIYSKVNLADVDAGPFWLVDPLDGSSFWIMKHFQKWEVLKPGPDDEGGEVYTDDFNSLLVAGSQRITEEKLWAHSQEIIPPAVWDHLLGSGRGGA